MHQDQQGLGTLFCTFLWAGVNYGTWEIGRVFLECMVNWDLSRERQTDKAFGTRFF
jgi:hypothetical protein